jgi:osmotically-inducible protein OsmY
LHLRVACQDAWVTVSGAVDRETDRKVVEETVAQIPGVAGVKDEMTVMTLRPPSL